MKVIQNSKGYYFVKDNGFTATVVASATRFSNAEVEEMRKCLASAGHRDTYVVDVPETVDVNIKQNTDGSSFAVSFVRPKQLRSDGSINTHKLNPSKRRFATHAEAVKHGSRFMGIEKHLGFYVTKRYEQVNSYVSAITGKTNPEVGKARTNR